MQENLRLGSTRAVISQPLHGNDLLGASYYLIHGLGVSTLRYATRALRRESGLTQ